MKPTITPGILITRPKGQTHALCEALRALQITPWLLPTIDIVPLPATHVQQQWERSLPTLDKLIFVSPNAVRHSAIANYYARLAPQVRIGAVGTSTAQALQQQHIPVSFVPMENFSSEGLLAHPELQAVHQRHIVIVKGEGGRELLQRTLTQRGATVETLSVYRRQCAHPDNLSTILTAFQQQKIHCVIVTSETALENLVAILGQAGYSYLTQIPLLVSSQRIAARARALGIQTIPLIASNATDTALISTLTEFLG